MRRSQEQPVKMATAAGGKRIVTCERDKYCVVECGGGPTRMRRMSDPRTMLDSIKIESRGGVQGVMRLRQVARHKQR